MQLLTSTELKQTLELFSAESYIPDLLSHWSYLFDCQPDEPLRKLDATCLEIILGRYLFELSHPENSYVSFREIWNTFQSFGWTDADLQDVIGAIASDALDDVFSTSTDSGEMTFRGAMDALWKRTLSYLAPIRTHVNEAANG